MQALFEPVLTQINQIVLGKAETVQLACACLLAGGHLLLEDRPGVGKTTLAHTLAKALGLEFKRVQFTNDLLPADLLGISIYEPPSVQEGTKGQFIFHPGPAFTQVLLADEINRATPKTQSAMLELMEEQQVTIDGQARPVPQPFFVIATQNPQDSVGTFALPESQLDRFLMRLSLGYPDRAAERLLLAEQRGRERLSSATGVLSTATLLAFQQQVREQYVSPAILDYVQDLLAASRAQADLLQGLSPRAGLALLQAARAWSWLAGRDHVQPEDIQMVFPYVAGHRLHTRQGQQISATQLRQLWQGVSLA
ncbi:AAA family ATPase [Parvibium lacunae]|uniref:MoxR family ATPase n=1 Tax=Parvibium lacunae TaxID=1888893 RepID=A0A368L4J2_9BURK|nr:MoxR family ATPase [Parvibium lacunae]RCS58494.1 MoxR family ATPase [Parvibium lacunae]